MKYWIDPPMGWRFGFPKVWDTFKQSDIVRFLVENGYPERYAILTKTESNWPVRMWVEENDSEKGN